MLENVSSNIKVNGLENVTCYIRVNVLENENFVVASFVVTSVFVVAF